MVLSGTTFGQTAIKKDNISSGGGSNTIGNTSVIYTVGEVVVQENTNGNTHISEGFISPDLLQAFDIEEYTILEGVSIYPNPASSIVNIQFDDASHYQIILTDISGKQLLETSSDTDLSQQIDIQHLDRAIYFLIIKDLTNKKYKVFKLIKK